MMNRMISNTVRGSVRSTHKDKFQDEVEAQSKELRELYPDAEISVKFTYSGDLNKRDLDPSGFTVTAERGNKVIATRNF